MAKECPKFPAVLPWLQLAEEIEVGPFTFWRWPEDSEKYFPKQLDRDRITQSINKAFSEMKLSPEVRSWGFVPLSSFCIISGRDEDSFFGKNEFRPSGARVLRAAYFLSNWRVRSPYSAIFNLEVFKPFNLINLRNLGQE